MLEHVPCMKPLSVLLALLLTPSATVAQILVAQTDSTQTAQQPSQQPLPSKDCGESRIMGETDAKTLHSGSGWMAGGFFSGLALGLIGTGIITAAAASTDPLPKNVPPDVVVHCYTTGYTDKAGNRNTWKAFGGGLLGTVVIVTVLVVASSSDE